MKYKFGSCTFDTNRRELNVSNQIVQLSPRVYYALDLLLAHHGRVVGKKELMRHVWHGVVVTNNTVDRCISELRKILDKDAASIRTIHGHGFIFDGVVDYEGENRGVPLDLHTKRPFVFISYSHEDSKIADQIADRLKIMKIDSFLDRKDIAWGDSIANTVRAAISKCTHQVIVLSPASIKSQWVHFEAGYAMGTGRIALPYLTHSSLDVPKYFQDLLYITTIDALSAYFFKWLEKIDTKESSLQDIKDELEKAKKR